MLDHSDNNSSGGGCDNASQQVPLFTAAGGTISSGTTTHPSSDSPLLCRQRGYTLLIAATLEILDQLEHPPTTTTSNNTNGGVDEHTTTIPQSSSSTIAMCGLDCVHIALSWGAPALSKDTTSSSPWLTRTCPTTDVDRTTPPSRRGAVNLLPIYLLVSDEPYTTTSSFTQPSPSYLGRMAQLKLALDYEAGRDLDRVGKYIASFQVGGDDDDKMVGSGAGWAPQWYSLHGLMDQVRDASNTLLCGSDIFLRCIPPSLTPTHRSIPAATHATSFSPSVVFAFLVQLRDQLDSSGRSLSHLVDLYQEGMGIDLGEHVDGQMDAARALLPLDHTTLHQSLSSLASVALRTLLVALPAAINIPPSPPTTKKGPYHQQQKGGGNNNNKTSKYSSSSLSYYSKNNNGGGGGVGGPLTTIRGSFPREAIMTVQAIASALLSSALQSNVFINSTRIAATTTSSTSSAQQHVAVPPSSTLLHCSQQPITPRIINNNSQQQQYRPAPSPHLTVRQPGTAGAVFLGGLTRSASSSTCGGEGGMMPVSLGLPTGKNTPRARSQQQRLVGGFTNLPGVSPRLSSQSETIATSFSTPKVVTGAKRERCLTPRGGGGGWLVDTQSQSQHQPIYSQQPAVANATTTPVHGKSSTQPPLPLLAIPISQDFMARISIMTAAASSTTMRGTTGGGMLGEELHTPTATASANHPHPLLSTALFNVAVAWCTLASAHHRGGYSTTTPMSTIADPSTLAALYSVLDEVRQGRHHHSTTIMGGGTPTICNHHHHTPRTGSQRQQ